MMPVSSRFINPRSAHECICCHSETSMFLTLGGGNRVVDEQWPTEIKEASEEDKEHL